MLARERPALQPPIAHQQLGIAVNPAVQRCRMLGQQAQREVHPGQQSQRDNAFRQAGEPQHEIFGQITEQQRHHQVEWPGVA